MSETWTQALDRKVVREVLEENLSTRPYFVAAYLCAMGYPREMVMKELRELQENSLVRSEGCDT